MNELKTLFQDIKNIFKEEGVETDPETKAVLEATVETSDEPVTESKETTETTNEKFEDVVLADGSVAQIEPAVEVGAAVVVAVDDELVAAPDGMHELADGRKIETEGGVIVSVEEAEEVAEEEEVEEEMETENPFTEAQEREAKKIIESIVTERVFGMEATLEEENKELKKEISNLKEAFNCLLDLTEKLVEKPTTEPVKKNKSGFAKLKPKKTDLIARLKSKNIIN
tara:strand:- start:167 stop:847 length:681 start_codon:yes stop_codon:yes gene_type:complete